MQFYKRFIAVGLGLGLTFTGTCMSYSWFTDTSSQYHSIKIEELVEKWKNDIIVRYGCLHNDGEKDEITIDFNKTISGTIQKIEIQNKNGNFSNSYIEERNYGKQRISIEREKGEFTDLGNTFRNEQSMEVKVTRTEGKGSNKKTYVDVYMFQFRTVNNKLEYRYLLSSSVEVLMELEIEEDEIKDQVDKPIIEDSLENDNNGAETLPEVDESDSDTSSGNEAVIPPELDESDPEISPDNGIVTLPEQEQPATLPLYLENEQ